MMPIPIRVLVLALALLPTGAFAQNSVSLTPASQNASTLTPVELDLAIAFSQEAIGGGVIVEVPSNGLAFTSFSWDPAFPDDPSLRLVCPSAHPACDDFTGPGVLVAFASDGSVNPPLQGSHVVGTLAYQTKGLGGAIALTVKEDDSGIAGPFVGTGSFAAPTLNGAVVNVVPPAPALLWPVRVLLLALLTALGARRAPCTGSTDGGAPRTPRASRRGGCGP